MTYAGGSGAARQLHFTTVPRLRVETASSDWLYVGAASGRLLRLGNELISPRPPASRFHPDCVGVGLCLTAPGPVQRGLVWSGRLRDV
ncbi:hypothetical protein chiPu_0002079 [Chiloscyllium punctatum]|uniref:Uncharacterized protein n=1 Tax=Chiloscyllium punctatum TaxID=137246 RepID=A0A401RZU7_CHIPU|nr:hypothetical protein [Chiloscyllium punctatum]